MAKKKRILMAVMLLVIITIAGLLLFRSRYVIISGEICSRTATEVALSGDGVPDVKRLQRIENLQNLDLTDISIQPEEFKLLQAGLPECSIYWMVPFQDGYCENTVSEVTVRRLGPDQTELLKFFPNLKTVDAQNCEDYEALMQLQRERPDLTVIYTVDVGDCELRENVTECVATDENAKHLLDKLQYLPELKLIDGTGCMDYESLLRLRNARNGLEVNYDVELGSACYSDDATQITLENADGQQALELLQYLPELTEVVFTGTVPGNEIMYQLKCRYPNVVMNWEFELFGVQTSSVATELILNEIPMESTDAVEDAMKYFYHLERVEMCDCGISGEDMDALNKRHPETRFIWMVHVGIGSLRTDAVGCIPYHLHYNLHRPFYDKEAKDLKYCTDLIALDLGHMMVTDLSFLQYMPKLKYLVLGDMELVQDFSYIANLTELVFLEIFQTNFKDVSLLMNMKKLEDLNISWTKLDNPELLKEMTWLKRLWCTSIGTSQEELKELAAALPDTLVYYKSLHPTEGGWRNSQNYRDMRDTLNMFYMH